MYNDVITLVGTSKTVNAVGDVVETEAETQVFAQVKAVSSKRKLEALAIGLKYQWKFVIADYYDYNGQEKAKYNGYVYNIVDTYRTQDNQIELTVSGV